MGLLEGKVTIITGAGGGLGRSHALAFAKEGAKVVVNDLGGGLDGSGGGNSMADSVVAEIKEMGGEAVAHYGSVSKAEDAKGMVQKAIDTWGRLDVVVNNAGILRDRTLLKLEDENFDVVMEVHARGTYLVGKHAAQAMKELGNGGSIINTTSIAGLTGNFGQTNYACAKAGIWGMTLVWAKELSRAGIRCNAVAPMAKTRMTEDISAVPDDVTPEKISPVVLFLASDLSQDINGRTFGAHGDHVFEYKMKLTPGARTEGELWTPGTLADRLDEITRLSEDKPSGEIKEASTEEVVEALFMAMPEGFKPEKAVGWNANLRFVVAGTGTYSLIIGDGACRALAGEEGSPTATVKIDSAATILGIAKGEQDAQQAFMAGKMSADNLGDLMKFSQALSMKKAGEAAQRVLDGGASSEDPLAEGFSQLAAAFMPDKAGNWESTIHFEIEGSGSWTLQIKGGACSAKEGKPNSAACNITYDSAATFMKVLTGELEAQQAFMGGQIRADNMAELMKFAGCFDMSGQATKKPASEEPASSGPPSEGMNRENIGKTYRQPSEFVRLADTEAYARATNDLNPVYMQGDAPIAPPLYAVRPVFAASTQAVMDDSLNCNILRILHGEQDMRFHAPLMPKDLICARATVLNIEDKGSGELIEVQQRIMRDGEAVCEIVSGYFVRGPDKAKEEKSAAQAEKEEPREILFESSFNVDADQSLRYAEASLDKNPIHVDDNVAKAAGLPGIILHGLCTMAMSSREIVNHACNGDPLRLKRIKVRFSRIVLPEDTLTTRAWLIERNEGISRIGFETTNQKGESVITKAFAEIAD